MSTSQARKRWAAAVGVCALVVAAPVSATSKQEPKPPATTEGRLATKEGRRVIDVPLEHTEVKIRVAGHLAEVEVEQTFRNPYDKKIEAVYLFPLPTGAAVNDLEIQIGERVVKGEIAKREEAKATYVKARKAGFVAALLTQERPNLFTQNLANLEPGARVTVRLRYLEPLRYEAGGYEIVFPMVAGPRYVPKASKAPGANAAAAPDAADDAVAAAAADSAAVQPAVLPEGVRSSHDIGLSVEIDAGVPLSGVRSPSHQIVHTGSGAQARVTLAAGDTVPNKDFVLRYDVAGAAPALAVLAHRDAGAAAPGGSAAPGSFFLMLQPPADAAPAQVTPRELVFVLDTSSSMRGAPLVKARELVRKMLTTLGPDDTFQIVRFDDQASALGERPFANKPKNVEWALAWMDALEAGGGTEVLAGLAAALDFPHDPARLRLVVFVTDGYVGNEDEILATVHARLGESRLYSFGVGTAVNRYLLEEMASFGRGAVQVVRPDEDTGAAVAKFHARVAQPVLTDVSVDWGGLAVADVTPAAIPDLFVGQPIVLAGHYARAGTAKVTVKGRAGGREVSFEIAVVLPEHADRPAIATVWARARIAELSRAEIRGATEATREEITRIALAHRLMSRYTAFVAVDRTRTAGAGDAARVAVPVEVPDGLRATGSVGSVYGGSMGSVATGSYGSIGGSVSYGIGSGGGGGIGHASGVAIRDVDVAREPMVVAAPPLPKQKPVDGRVDAEASPAGKAGKDDDAVTRGQRQQTLADKRPALVRLYDEHLRVSPGLAGKYVLRFTIAASGAVKKVELVSMPTPKAAGAEAFGQALLAEASTWKLPAAGIDVVVTYPIDFPAK